LILFSVTKLEKLVYKSRFAGQAMCTAWLPGYHYSNTHWFFFLISASFDGLITDFRLNKDWTSSMFFPPVKQHVHKPAEATHPF